MASARSPSVAFWATVMVVVLSLYALSIGPAVWVTQRLDSDTADECFSRIYAPIVWVYQNGPEPIHDVIIWWGHLWTP